MTDLEKLQKILTHPGYKVVLGHCKDVGEHLLVYKTTYEDIISDDDYREFRISVLPHTPIAYIVISPFLYGRDYDDSMLVLGGRDVYRLYLSTIEALLLRSRNETLAAFGI